MKSNIKNEIYIKSKESLEGHGIFSEKENPYNTNINVVDDDLLLTMLTYSYFLDNAFNDYFSDFYSRHSNDIEDKDLLKKIKGFSDCSFENLSLDLSQIMDFLEKENLIDKNELALYLAKSVYNKRTEVFKEKYDKLIRDEESDFYFEYKTNNPEAFNRIYQNNDVNEYSKFDLSKKKYIHDWLLANFGTTRNLSSSIRDFYESDFTEDSFSFIIANTTLNKLGINVDFDKIKELYTEKSKQFKFEKKKNMSYLQQKERELTGLEIEAYRYNKALNSIQKGFEIDDK